MIVFRIPQFGRSTDALTKKWLHAIYVLTASALASHRAGDSELAERALDKVDALTDMALTPQPSERKIPENT